MDRLLTKKILIELGFSERGKDILGKRIYDMPVGNYHIQIVLGDYPETNPNCGVVFIHHPATEAYTIPPDLIKKEEWTPMDHKRASEYTIPLKEKTQPIAWHVSREKRLKAIVNALTGTENFNI